MNKEILLKEFGSRLKSARLRKNLTQQELADLIETSKSMISGYENGRNDPAQSVLIRLAKELGVSINYLMTGKEDTLTLVGKASIIREYRYIPSPVAAGKPTEVEGQTYQTIAIPSHLLGKYAANPNIIIMKINGESMNKIIPNGSLIGILPYESTWDIKDGDIVVFTDESFNYSVKRYYKQGSRIVFRPESTDTTYIDIIYNLDEETVEIIGKVIMYNVIL